MMLFIDAAAVVLGVVLLIATAYAPARNSR
jgi:hypothetical protein